MTNYNVARTTLTLRFDNVFDEVYSKYFVLEKVQKWSGNETRLAVFVIRLIAKKKALLYAMCILLLKKNLLHSSMPTPVHNYASHSSWSPKYYIIVLTPASFSGVSLVASYLGLHA